MKHYTYDGHDYRIAGQWLALYRDHVTREGAGMYETDAMEAALLLHDVTGPETSRNDPIAIVNTLTGEVIAQFHDRRGERYYVEAWSAYLALRDAKA